MTKKSKSKSASPKKSTPKFVTSVSLIDSRKELLAKVAGAVAAGLSTTSTPSISTPLGMATVAVDIAEAILTKAGIPSTESAAEASAAPTRDASVGAAS
ncbi:MAG: hypothetical protein MUP97_16015 [Acidimicrobiia bacterium]|nr:hypothetical protein [Acidimicrobiia bacterium]